MASALSIWRQQDKTKIKNQKKLKRSYFFTQSVFERTFSFVFEINGKIHKSAHNKQFKFPRALSFFSCKSIKWNVSSETDKEQIRYWIDPSIPLLFQLSLMQNGVGSGHVYVVFNSACFLENQNLKANTAVSNSFLMNCTLLKPFCTYWLQGQIFGIDPDSIFDFGKKGSYKPYSQVFVRMFAIRTRPTVIIFVRFVKDMESADFHDKI